MNADGPEMLPPQLQNDINRWVERDGLVPLDTATRKFLWMVRTHCRHNSEALAKIIAAAPLVSSPKVLTVRSFYVDFFDVMCLDSGRSSVKFSGYWTNFLRHRLHKRWSFSCLRFQPRTCAHLPSTAFFRNGTMTKCMVFSLKYVLFLFCGLS